MGYSSSGFTYKCTACPDNISNGFKMTVLLIALIIVISFLVRQSLLGALEKRNLLSVYIRILLNHLQLLTLTASFDLSWPEQLEQFFSSVKPVSEITT